MKKSVNDYIPVEAKLSTGYSDIMIPNWSTIYDPWVDDIKDIEGIEQTTKIKITRKSKKDQRTKETSKTKRSRKIKGTKKKRIRITRKA